MYVGKANAAKGLRLSEPVKDASSEQAPASAPEAKDAPPPESSNGSGNGSSTQNGDPAEARKRTLDLNPNAQPVPLAGQINMRRPAPLEESTEMMTADKARALIAEAERRERESGSHEGTTEFISADQARALLAEAERREKAKPEEVLEQFLASRPEAQNDTLVLPPGVQPPETRPEKPPEGDPLDQTVFVPPDFLPKTGPAHESAAVAPVGWPDGHVLSKDTFGPTNIVPPEQARALIAESEKRSGEHRATPATPGKVDSFGFPSGESAPAVAGDPMHQTLFLPPGLEPKTAPPGATLPDGHVLSKETFGPTDIVPPEKARELIAEAEKRSGEHPAIPVPPAGKVDSFGFPSEESPKPAADDPMHQTLFLPPDVEAKPAPPEDALKSGATGESARNLKVVETPAFLPPPDSPFAPAPPAAEEPPPDSSLIGLPSASGFMLRRVLVAEPKPRPEALLQVQGLKKHFGKREVVKGVDLEVGQGEIVGLLGRNGAGKTTTFRMIMGMLHPDTGTVSYEHRDITRLPMYERANKGIGYLAQEPSVFQKMSVEDNLIAVLELQIGEASKRQGKMEELVRVMGLQTVRRSRAGTLSGGERRRLEIARAMTLSPKIVLFDEPFAGIDPIAVNEIQNILRDLKRAGVGVLLTDHNVRETLTITDRTYIMDEGQIWIHGSPREIVNHPEARKRYLGHDFRLDF